MSAITLYVFAELLMQFSAASWLLVAELRRAPLGYEDEFGFHYLDGRIALPQPVVDFSI